MRELINKSMTLLAACIHTSTKPSSKKASSFEQEDDDQHTDAETIESWAPRKLFGTEGPSPEFEH